MEKKTRGSSGTVLLSVRYKIPIVLQYCLFENDGIKIVNAQEIEIEKQETFKKTLEYNTQKIFDMFEEIIKKYPEQYMWQHKRWRK